MDQLFALVKAYLKVKLSWEVPEDVAQFLVKQLCPAVQQKGEVMHCVNMQGICAFSDWLQPLQVVWIPGNVEFMSMCGPSLHSEVYWVAPFRTLLRSSPCVVIDELVRN
jgi:hypothetical protein